MISPVRYPTETQSVAYPYGHTAGLKIQSPLNGKSGAPPLTALSIEFVAKPQEAHRVEDAIPAAIAGALKDVTGFAGCLVLISDQEARLVTVVTLWAGHRGAGRTRGGWLPRMSSREGGEPERAPADGRRVGRDQSAHEIRGISHVDGPAGAGAADGVHRN